MAKRAVDMKAFADVYRPFYASLSDEQKALSRIVLREGVGMAVVATTIAGPTADLPGC